jgi:hypothetical protein
MSQKLSTDMQNEFEMSLFGELFFLFGSPHMSTIKIYFHLPD